jgi:hypothetical protein
MAHKKKSTPKPRPPKVSKIAARTAYLSLFPSNFEAGEYEQRALSIGRDLLPPSARAVLQGKPATAAYWTWLVCSTTTPAPAKATRSARSAA